MKKSIEKKSTAWGLFISVIWVVGALTFVIIYWKEFEPLPPNAWGDFAAGVAAPMAFMWLVLGYFLQREELELQRKEIAALTRENERQANSIEKNERHARWNSFFQTSDIVLPELSSITAGHLKRLAHRGYRYESSGQIISISLRMLKIAFSEGERDVYFKEMIACSKGHQIQFKDVLDSHIGKEDISSSYCATIKNVLQLAEEADETGWLLQFCKMTSWGRLYFIYRELGF